MSHMLCAVDSVSNIEQIIFFGFWIIGQWRTTKEIGGSVLIYVLTLPFLKA